MSTQSGKHSILGSKFFNVPIKLSKKQLLKYCQLWWPLQAEFSLGTVVLTGKIAKELISAIREKDKASELLLRNILKWQAPASVDELGIGRVKTEIHDLLLKRQIEDAGLNFSEIEEFNLNTAPFQLLDLRKFIADALSGEKNIVVGLAMMYVVETIAAQLFTTQKNIFLNAGVSGECLTHSSIHIELEGSHAYEAAEFYGELIQYGDKEFVEGCIENFSKAWKAYLDRVAFEVYGE